MTCLARTTAAAGAVLGPAAAGAGVLVGRLPGAARRQRESLRHRAHRPWPLPDARWVMAQSWVDLLFCHWPVDEAQLRAHVPASLPLDRFDGRAWLSITPFEVQGTRPRGALPPPVLSRFPELNVRTYVVRDGKPGIWFFSLDAASALAVAAARGLYRLPYLRAPRPASRPAARGGRSRGRATGSTPAASAAPRAARRRASTPAIAPPAASATRTPARSRRGSSSATASTPSTTAGASSTATSTTARGRCRTPWSTCGRT